jgi:hypothetical protein
VGKDAHIFWLQLDSLNSEHFQTAGGFNTELREDLTPFQKQEIRNWCKQTLTFLLALCPEFKDQKS